MCVCLPYLVILICAYFANKILASKYCFCFEKILSVFEDVSDIWFKYYFSLPPALPLPLSLPLLSSSILSLFFFPNFHSSTPLSLSLFYPPLSLSLLPLTVSNSLPVVARKMATFTASAASITWSPPSVAPAGKTPRFHDNDPFYMSIVDVRLRGVSFMLWVRPGIPR